MREYSSTEVQPAVIRDLQKIISVNLYAEKCDNLCIKTIIFIPSINPLTVLTPTIFTPPVTYLYLL